MRNPGYSLLPWARRLSQAGFLALFVYLFHVTSQVTINPLDARVALFFEWDPLVLASVGIATRVVTSALLAGLVTLGLTVILGRWFCGWACPLGTLHQVAGTLRREPRKVARLHNARTPWAATKYLLLAGMLGAAWTGANVAGWMDPLAFLYRALTTSVYPVLHAGLSLLFGTVYDADPTVLGLRVTDCSEPLYDLLRRTVLLGMQPRYAGGALLGLLFLVALGLNLVRHRLWCRHLCPLGALLGVAGKNPLVRLTRDEHLCTGCRSCVEDCPGGAIATDGKSWNPAECFYCFNCTTACSRDALDVRWSVPGRGTWLGAPVRWVVHFLRPPPGTSLDVGRRALLGAGVVGVGAGLAARTGPLAGDKTFSPSVIRPPGAVREPELLDRCIRCGECMRACPTNAVQPAALEAGWPGLWTPVMNMRLGYCEYECTACSQVCPTGALTAMAPVVKKAVRIGTATFDRNRCLPYALGKDCIVCEEHCPIPKKAITFLEVSVVDYKGNTRKVKQPRVDPRRCTGCGICENKCPLPDSPGVFVTSVGESRNPKNQALLEEQG